ncbi:hypothetical protein BDW74DRAFT_183267 [Aspergillus multicolor]|uniref:uncharacterized protein n=1 Tax=Aspergillus multicolor TaxID=41759 RepID=UPI003CCD86F9
MDYPLGGLSTQAGRAAFIVTVVSMALVTVALVLRIYAKMVRRRNFMAHDYLYFGGYIMAIGYSAQFLYVICPNVIGMRLEDAMRLYPHRLEIALKIIAASTFIWAFATTLVKLCLLSLYIQIFKSELVFRILAYIVAALSPFAYNWDQTIEDGHCGDNPKFQLSTAVVNMILDFFIVILPLPVLWGLQMARKRKIMLSEVFSLGLCICAMNLTRTILVVTQNRADVTYSIALIGLFSILEVNVGMICAAFPTLGPLFFKDSASSGGGSGSSSWKINSFVRRKAAGLGIGSGKGVRIASGEGLSTLDEEDYVVPLRDVGGNRELGLEAGPESRINVRTDIYVA